MFLRSFYLARRRNTRITLFDGLACLSPPDSGEQARNLSVGNKHTSASSIHHKYKMREQENEDVVWLGKGQRKDLPPGTWK